MRSIVRISLLIGVLSACGRPQVEVVPTLPLDQEASAPINVPATAAPDPAPTATAPPRTWNQQGYRSDWTNIPAGQLPLDYVTAQQEGFNHPWMYEANWQIRQGGEGPILAAITTSRAFEPLSFLRYRGRAFGADGALPSRYRIDAEARSLGGANRYQGYGELALLAFYIDPTHYIEAVQNDEQLSLWEANDAEPNDSTGWRQLATYTRGAQIGEWVTFGVGIDLAQGRAWLISNGQPVASATSDLLRGSTGRFALRATGNRLEWRWITVQPLE